MRSETPSTEAAAAFSLVETMLAVALAATALSLGATFLVTLVRQTGEVEEEAAAEAALRTIEAHLRTRSDPPGWSSRVGPSDASPLVDETESRVWWVDRRGQRLAAETMTTPSISTARYFEVTLTIQPPVEGEGSLWKPGAEWATLALSWPAFDERGIQVDPAVRRRRIALTVLGP